MRSYIIVFLLVSSFSQGFSQETALYYDNGFLKYDTTLSVNPELLPTISEIEKVVHRIYRDIDYPWQAAENGVGALVIAKIHVSNDRLSTYCEIASSTHPAFNETVVNAVHKNSLTILRCTKGLDEFVFYLPFMFEATTSPILDDMKKYKAIRISTHRLEAVRVLM